MNSRIVADEAVYDGAVCRVHRVGLETGTGAAVAPGRLADMIRTGEVHDGKTLAAWALWSLREGG